MIRFTLSFLLFMLLATASFGQRLNLNKWTRIEKAIRDRLQLVEARKQVNVLRMQAEKDKNDIDLARSLYCEMLIKDLLTEDSLYFKNSAFIDTLIKSPQTSAELRAVMHLMQARRIDVFDRKQLKFTMSTYETRGAYHNYAGMAIGQRERLVMQHLQEVLLIQKRKLNVYDDILWLSSQKSAFLFSPDLEDIAITERIGIGIKRYRLLTFDETKHQSLFNQEGELLIRSLDSLAAQSDPGEAVFAGYKTWLNKHRSDPEISGYIGSAIKDYWYSLRPSNGIVKKAYFNHLHASRKSSLKLKKAAACFQLFNLYFEDGKSYEDNFESKYNAGYGKAVAIYDQEMELVSKYPAYKSNMDELVTILKKPRLQAVIKDFHVPEAPILVKVKYQNVGRFYYKIYKSADHDIKIEAPDQIRAYVKDKQLVVDSAFSLPGSEDYNLHAIYLKLNGLPKGSYNLVFSNSDSGSGILDLITFQVSGIAVVNTKEQMIVLDRWSGFPLEGVKMQVVNPAKLKGAETNKYVKSKIYVSNHQGLISIGKTQVEELLLTYKGDTLQHSFDYRPESLPDEIYNKDEYDDLLEYHDDHLKMQLYLDRGIYRPGQKVFYKVILLSRNPKTGEQIVFSKQSGKVFKSWVEENEPLLLLKDPDNKIIDSARLVIDRYGSCSGSFILPKKSMTGSWSISSEFQYDDADTGEFEVEEYKRPTYEVVINKPKKPVLPGEPFDLTVKTVSLSGVNLEKVKVECRVETNSSTKLIDTIGYTNEKGELSIKVIDTTDNISTLSLEDRLDLEYEITVKAIEETGEVAEAEDIFSVTSWPVKISLGIDDYYDRQKLPSLKISVFSEKEEFEKLDLEAKIFKIDEVPDTMSGRKVDQWVYLLNDLKKWFPSEGIHLYAQHRPQLTLISSNMVDSLDHRVDLGNKGLEAGKYKIVISSKKDGRVYGQFNKSFQIFGRDGQEDQPVFDYFPYDSYKPGGDAIFYYNLPDSVYVIYGLSYYEKTSNGLKLKNAVKTDFYKKGNGIYRFKIPDDAIGKVVLNHTYVYRNKLYMNEKDIYLSKALKEQVEVIVERYRKVLAPGEKETFSVAVKTSNRNVAAQLMTTMYDAALDKLAEHKWAIPKDDFRIYVSGYQNQSVSNDIHGIVYLHRVMDELRTGSVSDMLSGRVAGLYAAQADDKLDEVSVMGYSKKYLSTGSVVTIRNGGSLLDYMKSLIIVDGEIFTGNLAEFNIGSITESIALKGADATALYGSRAASGLLLISTKGKVVLPEEPKEVVAKVRRNFNETAFFFPNVHADRHGVYSFNFTMPESTTEWNWKMLAHTLGGNFAYADRKIKTQLRLMIQPHMPRHLYQGDELTLQSRIGNLDTLEVSGKSSIKIEDAVTGEDLTETITNGQYSNVIAIPARGNKYAAFKLRIPETQLNPLKIVVTVTTGQFADSEEHIIPVMSKLVLVKQSVGLRFSSQDTLVKAVSVPEDAKLYGVGITIDSKPQAALFNALPWLANYAYGCAEQTFNKMLANISALRIMRRDTLAKRVFADAKIAVSKDSSSKQHLLSYEVMETLTPWLSLENRQSLNQRQLYQLLDTVNAKTRVEEYLQKIRQLQKPDGGISWFGGGESSYYISNYILAGFGKLSADGWIAVDANTHRDFITKLIAFGDVKAAAGMMDMDYINARSYWKDSYPLNNQLKTQIENGLRLNMLAISKSDLYFKLLNVISCMRFFSKDDALYKMAKSELESIYQLAIYDSENGLRWKDIGDSDDLNANTEEVIELLSIAFDLGGRGKEVRSGLLKWVLKAKNGYEWKTTKGTAAAINLFLKEYGTVMSEKSFTALVDDHPLSVSDDLLNGTSAAFKKTARLAPISLSKPDKTATVSGHATWYYFTHSELLNGVNKNIKLIKRLYYYDDRLKNWEAFEKDFVFKVGTRVRVNLSIETLKPLRYVLLEDNRAAAFEPVGNESGYRSGIGLDYYESIRDHSFQFFAEFIPSGVSEISYQMTVTQEGVFTNGPVVLSCMYKPEIVAYSNALTVKSSK